MKYPTSLLLAVVLGGTAACSQTAPPPPISTTQRAQLWDVAASPVTTAAGGMGGIAGRKAAKAVAVTQGQDGAGPGSPTAELQPRG